ncbi:MAG: hypothetical protein NZL91_03120 [Thermoflexales bacterium]|nr:hypothetical protein [Thermoflexales bacterium]MCS7325558.1 hypothetical protein [Thermoflexales bacterium]MCX7938788.1 hypothetical protein [Thermoflexales bacterium]MDW8054642.1 hypothetical protein [Anaerolineae bacterium]MDW8292976.1 hypothetical protein [Anaerolineae bacterium]
MLDKGRLLWCAVALTVIALANSVDHWLDIAALSQAAIFSAAAGMLRLSEEAVLAANGEALRGSRCLIETGRG